MEKPVSAGVATARQDRPNVLALAGEIDLHVLPTVTTALDEMIAKNPKLLVVDLSGVPYIDSAGVVAIIVAMQAVEAYGGKFALAGLQETVRSILEISGLDRVFSIFPNVDAAFSVAVPALEPKRRIRILVVDDDRNSTHLIKVLLERIGFYLVFEENDGTKAHQAARDFKPDLILLDIDMPERDGGDVALQIETDPELQRTPIVFLTALVTEAEAKGGLRVQGRPTVAKPISMPDLINAVEENLPCITAFQAANPAIVDQMGGANQKRF